MFSYYGSKTNLVDLYPPPKYGAIIEPFAGAAKYALRYFDREVTIIDKYPTIVRVWKFLQSCSIGDIKRLPHNLKETDRLTDFGLSEDEMLLMGFVVGCGAERPRIKATKRKTTDRPNHVNYNLERIAKDLFKIKHWRILEGDYTSAPVTPATYFIDPPYQFGGHAYVMGNKNLNYLHLSLWVRSLPGQVIVCENTKANWMGFHPIIKQRGSLFATTEAIWTNLETSYNVTTQTLF